MHTSGRSSCDQDAGEKQQQGVQGESRGSLSLSQLPGFKTYLISFASVSSELLEGENRLIGERARKEPKRW